MLEFLRHNSEKQKERPLPKIKLSSSLLSEPYNVTVDAEKIAKLLSAFEVPDKKINKLKIKIRKNPICLLNGTANLGIYNPPDRIMLSTTNAWNNTKDPSARMDFILQYQLANVIRLYSVNKKLIAEIPEDLLPKKTYSDFWTKNIADYRITDFFQQKILETNLGNELIKLTEKTE